MARIKRTGKADKKRAQRSATKKAAKARTAPKRKAPAKQPPSLAQMRGVVTFETNEILVLVHAPIDRVTEAFRKHKRARVCCNNVAGKVVTISDPCYLAYQLQGHPWTVIDGYVCDGNDYPRPEDAKALSKALKTRAIFYGNSDTAGATGYDLFDCGKRLEHLEAFEEIEFESQLGREGPSDPCAVEEFVEAFIREQDAFAPAWSGHLGGWRCDDGEKVKLPFGDFGPEDLVRLDFVAV